MNYLKQLLPLIMLVSFTGSSLWVNAQGEEEEQQMMENEDDKGENEVSDEELEKFAKISGEMKGIHQNQRSKMQKAVKNAGLTVEKYQSLKQRMMGKGQKKNRKREEGEDGEVSEKEKKQFQKAQKKVNSIKKETRKKQKKVITSNGLTQERFQEIYQTIRSSRELQQKLKKMQEGQVGDQ